MREQATDSMSRGLLTDAEKRAIRGEIPDENRTSTYISRAKSRLQNQVAEDAQFLHDHRADLYDLLHAAVCEEPLGDRVEDLEHEVESLKREVQTITCPQCGEVVEGGGDELMEHAKEKGCIETAEDS